MVIWYIIHVSRRFQYDNKTFLSLVDSIQFYSSKPWYNKPETVIDSKHFSRSSYIGDRSQSTNCDGRPQTVYWSQFGAPHLPVRLLCLLVQVMKESMLTCRMCSSRRKSSIVAIFHDYLLFYIPGDVAYQGPLLLIWINLNSSMDKQSYAK